MRRFTWLLIALGILVAVVAGCSSSLREVRARAPEFQFPGVAASSQLEVARCIRDVLDRVGGESSIIQEIALEPDGMHVIGRPAETLSAWAAVYDVAIRADAVLAMMAPASVIPRDTLRYVIAACVGVQREQAR